MTMIANPGLLAGGIVAILLGIWLWRWSARHAIDLKGAAMSAAWQGVRTGKIPDVPDDLKTKYQAVAGQGSHAGKAATAGGIAARHVVAKVVGLASYMLLLGGAALAAAGIWWR